MDGGTETQAHRDHLRRARMRVTRPRLAVLRALHEAHQPLSHGELAERLPDWDRATLFRNLVDLADAGLLRRLDAGDHTWRFECAADEAHAPTHAHFTCTACGEVSCLEGVRVVFEASLPGSVDLSSAEVHLRGRCERCTAAG